MDARPRRAPNGASSIFLGSDGRWHGWVSMPPSTPGSRNRRHVSAMTRAVVTEKVRDLERQRDHLAAARSVEELTVEDWFGYWLDTIAAARVRARTLEGYRSIVRRHVAPAVGHRRLRRLRPEHLEQLYGALLARGLSPATVLRVHRVISRALKVAHQREHVRRDVSRLVDPPAQRRSQLARSLTLDDARAVLAAAGGRRNAARWSVALALGLRQSEALALQWSDVDFATGTLSVRRTLHRVTGRGLVYEEPKTDRSRRTLALPAQLASALLHAHRTAQLGERLTAGPSWHDNDLVFAQANGRPIDRHSDYNAWSRLLEDAGVAHVRLHDARHTAATLLLVEGVHPRVVMELLGHSQMRTTTDIYSHVMPALARNAADRMGAILLADCPAAGQH